MTIKIVQHKNSISTHIHQEVPFLLLFQGGNLPRWQLLGPHRHELAASLLLRPVAGATLVKRDIYITTFE